MLIPIPQRGNRGSESLCLLPITASKWWPHRPPGCARTRAERQREDWRGDGVEGLGRQIGAGQGLKMLLGSLYPGGCSRSLACSPIQGGGWAAPLSRSRVQAGRACTPPGRCQGLHNGAPGVGARPAHSAPNNHCSAAAGPVASRGGRT